ncbi:MAG: Crp/Fnr family transcriptional regulator [Deltaproteobacteria bacterium]|nr:Crp/Fnr family transcriptional regulator [Deltaproteobacteria bacterium]
MGAEFIKKIPLFSELSPKEVERLENSLEIREYPGGSIVVYKGDVGHVLYLVLEGEVKVVLTSQEGKELILNTLQAGDYFGEMSVLDHMPRSATIVTIKPSRFMVITRDILIDQIRQHPKLAMKLLSEMSKRLREADEQINSLAHLDVRGRVAQTLIKLSKKENNRTEEGQYVISRPAEKDIADMSGTSRETVSRILGELSKNGIISLTKEEIIIHEDIELDE